MWETIWIFNWYMNHGWDFVCDKFSLNMFGKNITFSHRPIPWDGFYEVNVHGHLHNLCHRIDERSWIKQWHYLVNVEDNNYKPLLLRSIIEEVDRRK